MAAKVGEVAVESTFGVDPGVKDCSSWQTSCGGLSARLGTVRARKLWTDCQVLVGEERSPIGVHRVLLAAASPVLAAMLYGPMSTPDQPLHLPDVEAEIFELLLEYMYTDNITINSCVKACSVYKAANYLILPHVQEICKTYIINNLILSPNCIIYVYEFSKLYDDKEIMNLCLKLMIKVTSAVLEAGVENAQPETLRQLFALPSLAIMSELDLFETAERWVRARILTPTNAPASNPTSSPQNSADVGTVDAKPRTPESVSSTKESNGGPSSAKLMKMERNGVAKSVTAQCDGGVEVGDEGRKSIKIISENNEIKDAKMLIRDAVKEIRFLTLDPEEFAAHDTSTLLSESERLAILSNLVSKNNHMVIPEGFCSSKEVRNKFITFKVSVPLSATVANKEYRSKVNHIQGVDWVLSVKNHNNKKLVWLGYNMKNYGQTSVFCYVQVRVFSQKRNIPSLYYHAARREFRNAMMYGIPSIDWDYLTHPQNGYVQNDAVEFEVRVLRRS